MAEAANLATIHLYYDDTELFSSTSTLTAVLELETNGEKQIALVLDKTVMHPQGGTFILYACNIISPIIGM